VLAATVNSLQTYLNRIRRHLWLVLAITLIATVGALVYTVRQPTTYTARSTLTTASQNRSPDQDAYLAEAFAQYFNKPSYQERIRALAQVPNNVRVSALTGATSPILYIQATGPDPGVASRLAAQVAERFREDVQANANASRDEELSSIEKRIKDKQRLLRQLKGDSDERALILSEILDLQRQANDMRDNTTNQLVALQRDAGVSAHLPSPILNGLLGFAGGLALGCAAALALAALRNRIATPDDVRGLLGLPTLGVLDRTRRDDNQSRAQRLESIAAVVSLSDLPRPATLAITTPRRTNLTTHIAEGIVYYQALQGARTLLVRADLRGVGSGAATHGSTVASLLAGTSDGPPRPMEIRIGSAEMLVLPAGMASTADPFALFAPEAFQALLGHLRGLADLIVIEAPPVNEAAESQIICAAADQTVLVVEKGITRGSDGSRACESLTQVGASMLGVVLGRPVQHNGHAEPFSTLPVLDTGRRPQKTPPSHATAPVPDPLVVGGGAEDEHASPRINSPRAGTEGIDSAPPVALAESKGAVAPTSVTAPPDATASRPRRFPRSSAARNRARKHDDKRPDTESMAALKDTGERTRPADEARPPALSPQPAEGVSAGEYLLYSDALLVTHPAGSEPLNPSNTGEVVREWGADAPHEAPAGNGDVAASGEAAAGDGDVAASGEAAAGNGDVAASDEAPAGNGDAPAADPPDLDTAPTLVSSTPLVTDLPRSTSPADLSMDSMILATDCPHGHYNPPAAANCRVCGAVIPAQDARLVSRPVLCVLRANDGTSAEVDRAVLVGRVPDPSRSSFEAPRLMRLRSSGHNISRTHVEVAPEGWRVVATDLDSKNGTILVHPGGRDRQELTPGQPIPVPPGSVLELGEGVSITVGRPS
jgi:capsular polysaccharide biosynthesis protein